MSGKRKKTKSWIDEVKEVQEQILAARGGVPLPDSTDFIRACRDGVCEVCGRDIVDVILEKENRTVPDSADIIHAGRVGVCPDHEGSG